MADTTRWTLQQCADAAGKRVAPYPTCAEAGADQGPHCRGCGAALTGQTTKVIKASGLPRVFCSRECLRLAQRRWRSGPDESAALTMSQYSW